MQFPYLFFLGIAKLFLSLFVGVTLFYYLVKKWRKIKYSAALKIIVLYELCSFLLYLIYPFSFFSKIFNNNSFKILDILLFGTVLFFIFYLITKKIIALNWEKALMAFFLIILILFPFLDFVGILLGGKIISLPIFAEGADVLKLGTYGQSFFTTLDGIGIVILFYWQYIIYGVFTHAIEGNIVLTILFIAFLFYILKANRTAPEKESLEKASTEQPEKRKDNPEKLPKLFGVIGVGLAILHLILHLSFYLEPGWYLFSLLMTFFVLSGFIAVIKIKTAPIFSGVYMFFVGWLFLFCATIGCSVILCAGIFLIAGGMLAIAKAEKSISKKYRIALIVFMTIACLFLTIVFIDNNRPKGAKDPRIAAGMNQIRSEAQIVERDTGSYAGVCADADIVALIKDINSLAPSKAECHNSALEYCVTVELNSGDFYCVDSDLRSTSDINKTCTADNKSCEERSK